MRTSGISAILLFAMVGAWFCSISNVLYCDTPAAEGQLELAGIQKDNPPKVLSKESVDRGIYAALEGKGQESGIAIIGQADPTTLRLSVAFWLEHCGDFHTLCMKDGLTFKRDGKGKIDYAPGSGMSLWTVNGLRYVWDVKQKFWKLADDSVRQPQSWSEDFVKSHSHQTIHLPFYFKDYHGDWPIIEGAVPMGWKDDSGRLRHVSAEQVEREMKKFLNDSGDSKIFAVEAIDAYSLPHLLERWDGKGHFYGNVQRLATVDEVVMKFGGGKYTRKEEYYEVDAGNFRKKKTRTISELLGFPEKPENASAKWDAAKAWVNEIFHKMNCMGHRDMPDMYTSKSRRLWVGWTPLRRNKKGAVSLDPKATWPITFTMWDGSQYQLLDNGEAFVLGIANFTWPMYWSKACNAGRVDRRNVLLIFMNIKGKSSSVAYEALLLREFPWGSYNPFLAYCASRLAPDKLANPFIKEKVEEKKSKKRRNR